LWCDKAQPQTRRIEPSESNGNTSSRYTVIAL
jgi:hypothetical protein